MYRTFLSWRYLITRRTNLIGMVGILVAVAALIMILSIMTGFLEQTRAMVRGGLADLVVTPELALTRDDVGDRTLAGIQSTLRADPRVAASSPRIVMWAMLGEGGRRSEVTHKTQSDPYWGGKSVVEAVGVDVAGPLRASSFVAESIAGVHGLRVRAPEVIDELETSGLRAAMERAPRANRFAAPVENVQFPFTLPRDYEHEGRPSYGAVVGEALFNALGLSRGSEITLVGIVPLESGDVAQTMRDFIVTGTFRTKDNEMDGTRIFVPRTELADMLNDGREFTQVVVRMHDYETEAESLVADVGASFGAAGYLGVNPVTKEIYPNQLRTWEDFRETLIGAIENERVLMAIMLSLILVVAGFTIFSILTMMVTEKRRDIGILAAIGASQRGILSTFLLIGFWNALVGSVVGAILGILGARYIDNIERWLSNTFGIQIFNRDVYYFDTIPSRVEVLPVALIVGGAFFCTLLFAAVPAWRAARLHPLDALRYE